MQSTPAPAALSRATSLASEDREWEWEWDWDWDWLVHKFFYSLCKFLCYAPIRFKLNLGNAREQNRIETKRERETERLAQRCHLVALGNASVCQLSEAIVVYSPIHFAADLMSP